MTVKKKIKREDIHTISMTVANKPGVLVRIALAFAKRGYNIDSLVVSPSVNPRFSRMTITAQGDPETLEQIIMQTNKLVDVIHANEHTGEESIDTELALFKVNLTSSNKPVLAKFAKKYNAKILNEENKAMIIQQTGDTEELDEFEDVLKKYGIVEMVRTGKVVMTKGHQET